MLEALCIRVPLLYHPITEIGCQEISNSWLGIAWLESASWHAGIQRAKDRGELFNVAKPSEDEEADISAGTVMLMTLLMASAAGLGSLPFFFVGEGPSCRRLNLIQWAH